MVKLHIAPKRKLSVLWVIYSIFSMPLAGFGLLWLGAYVLEMEPERGRDHLLLPILSVTFYGLGGLTLVGWVVMVLALPFTLLRIRKTPQPLVINHVEIENARSEFGLDTLRWLEVRDVIRYEDEGTDMVGINLVREAAHRKPRK